jgi:16S rRNA (cytidine1402-2'-O)-methyltransferase
LIESGTLFIVATPIGNLEDITHRALRILAEVDLIAAEDTRHSQRLLQHDHNESQRAKQLIEKLKLGENIALISDAGTPLISDPGYGLVSQCRDAGLKVVPLPGPCAVITALCAAGLATDRFKFEGFLPVKAVAKQQALQRLLTETSTSVFYESPRRVAGTVRQIIAELGEDRQMVVAKELTKTFETFYSGSAQACLTWLEADTNHQRGEFVLLIAGQKQDQTEISADALNLLKLLIKELPLKKAAAVTAEQYGLKKNQLYQLGLELQL